ncbi:MAG: tripartite tricarboxylate transporter permease [Chloroflexi bacterium]|nr:tripartite tricarboxylate transporter permease [Chloroflexota bacterium]
MLDTLFGGVSALATVEFWIAVFAATALAGIVGLIPGIGSITVLAISVPFVVFQVEDPVIGLVFLATIGGVSNTLDSIPAVLLGYPSSATQVTFLEGHQRAQRGLGASTLGAVYAVSMLGGFVGAVALALTIPVIKPVVLQFGFAEVTAMALFGIAMVSVLSRGAMVKGLIAAAFGILLSTAGVHGSTSVLRFTFGQPILWEGLPIIVVSLGAFALPEILDLTTTGRPVAASATIQQVSTREVFAGFREGLKRWKVTIRQSLFGVFMGAIPGIGSSVVDWLAYGFGIALSKDKSEFGKGSLDGVLFAESAQNSKEAGQAIPTLALGIPGGLTWVFVLVGMLSYGIAPGPDILTRHGEITITIVVAFAVGNFLVALWGLVLTGQLAKVTLIPYAVLAAAIIPISFLAVLNAMTDWISIPIVLASAVLGLIMKALGWPRPPLILGFILGSVVEINLQSALSAYGPLGILTRPFTLVLLIILLVTVYLLTVRFDSGEKLAASTAAPSSGNASSGVQPPAGGEGRRSRFSLRFKPTWGPDVWATIVMIAVGAWVLYEVRDMPARALMFPRAMAVVIVGLSLLLLSFKWTGRDKRADIMDIGMRSFGVEGAARRGLITAIGVLALSGGAVLIGLQTASVLFAFIYPAVMMQGRWRWISAGITGVIILLMSIFLFDYLMAVWWPPSIIDDPLQGLVG